MRPLKRLFTRLLNFTTRRRGDDRLREEIASHLAALAEENIRAGMAPEEARRHARLKFGDNLYDCILSPVTDPDERAAVLEQRAKRNPQLLASNSTNGPVLHLFRVLPEIPLYDQWLSLVSNYRVSGKNVHDAQLVAAMVMHGVEQILTFNGADFTRYAEISVLDPFQFS